MAKHETAVEGGQVLIATESFSKRYLGADHSFKAGVTRVREGHPILEGVRHLFKVIDAHYDVEAASAAPGEVRGA